MRPLHKCGRKNMEENLRKLNEDERLDDFSKILLLTGHINHQANIVREVMISRYQAAWAIEKGALGDDRKEEDGAFHRKLADDTKQFLKDVAASLYEQYEQLADFCNGCDAVSDIDMQLGEPIYDMFHDQVKVEPED
jgi:hypothetical protein